jgi:hypothetical protein
MQTPGQKRAENEIRQRIPGHCVDDHVVKQNLHHHVQEVDLRERKLKDHHRPQSIEEYLECAEECFAGDGIKKYGLQLRG